MTDGQTVTVDISGRRRRLLRVGLDHWSNALKRVASRVQGMGYLSTSTVMRRDREIIEGDNRSQGLLERLNAQGNLLEEEDEIPEDGTIRMDRDELRLSYYALRRHRERILDLKRDNEKEEYDAEEQERDLALIGEPAGDDGQSTGFLNELDLGWEEDLPDPDQIEVDFAHGRSGSAPSGAPSAGTEPSTSSGTEATSSDTQAGSDASSGTDTDDEKVAGSVGRRAEVMEFVEERLRENPDIGNQELQAEAEEQFPGAGIGDLSSRQFHARYPLQVKRKMATEG